MLLRDVDWNCTLDLMKRKAASGVTVRPGCFFNVSTPRCGSYESAATMNGPVCLPFCVTVSSSWFAWKPLVIMIVMPSICVDASPGCGMPVANSDTGPPLGVKPTEATPASCHVQRRSDVHSDARGCLQRDDSHAPRSESHWHWAVDTQMDCVVSSSHVRRLHCPPKVGPTHAHVRSPLQGPSAL